ncbi:hypothetical protein LB565_04220 [Mesorhizobium sp. CA14]|uniref:hypothetical protein n=1 Tax=Mesorhizobium sp. CA14 TaxID=2876642 RepID=UPI001CC8FC2D|nr:hypothetical protein [Mesorhizobium sp. CA14]MBZ9847193.1 hypothetical protein [Mesorhizobium sp. CA14]
MNAPVKTISTPEAVQEALSGEHAPMARVFPGKIGTMVGTRNAYVKCGGDVAVMTVGDDAEERARAAAVAIAAHDTLVAMVTLLQPSASPAGGIRVTITAEAFERLDKLLRPPRAAEAVSEEQLEAIRRRGPGPVIALPPPVPVPLDDDTASDIAFAIGAAMRRRNRSLHRGDQPIVPCMELAVTEMVLTSLAECGYRVVPPGQESTADSTEAVKLALAEVLAECDQVRAELKATGHAHEGDSLSRLVDRAIDSERERRRAEVDGLKDRLARVRAVAAI